MVYEVPRQPRERPRGWSTLIGAQTHAAYGYEPAVLLMRASTGNNEVQEPQAPPQVVRRWAWSQGARTAPLARKLFRRWLTALEASQYEEDATVCFMELLTNAFRIESPDGFTSTKWILGEDKLRVEVCDHSTNAPYLFTPNEESESGRGLLLVHFLADDWGYEHTTFTLENSDVVPGKTVWFELHR